MGFKKGSKIEVFSKSEVPSGAWQPADIISGNGHNYTVRYVHCLGGTNETVSERVSRKAIRPCPPPVNFRLLGSSRELVAHKGNIRVRQSWQDGEWIVIGKASGNSEAQSNRTSTANFQKKRKFPLVQADADKKVHARCDFSGIKNTTGIQESHVVSARTLKRAFPFVSSCAEAWTGNIQKLRAIEKEGEWKRVISGNPSSLKNKVDAVAYPKENLGETDLHTSFNNQTNVYYEIEMGKKNCVLDCSQGRGSDANDSDSDLCSVGSCSVISNSTSKLSSHVLAGYCQDAGTLSSDAESCSGHGDEEEKSPLPVGDDVAARIHSLELHAYRCTLEALYASGPLSWEQEALLTNLRITLHITNDEHLMELRNLISAGTNLHHSE
ncbi:uncharacterized protein LOC123194296 isoform X2 [Mangifera indica]|uniref:uncharacterized protein LOC123194296 isoform X2 n=1 Tax=Mangifera indica TaxID=29780 RepID=UPI001CFB76C4|nr:uncharacterized protein LOC123194296 isoform X2 [Mangifera indica]